MQDPIGRACGWTKGIARQRETWWWNDDVNNSGTETMERVETWK